MKSTTTAAMTTVAMITKAMAMTAITMAGTITIVTTRTGKKVTAYANKNSYNDSNEQ